MVRTLFPALVGLLLISMVSVGSPGGQVPADGHIALDPTTGGVASQPPICDITPYAPIVNWLVDEVVDCVITVVILMIEQCTDVRQEIDGRHCTWPL